MLLQDVPAAEPACSEQSWQWLLDFCRWAAEPGLLHALVSKHHHQAWHCCCPDAQQQQPPLSWLDEAEGVLTFPHGTPPEREQQGRAERSCHSPVRQVASLAELVTAKEHAIPWRPGQNCLRNKAHGLVKPHSWTAPAAAGHMQQPLSCALNESWTEVHQW